MHCNPILLLLVLAACTRDTGHTDTDTDPDPAAECAAAGVDFDLPVSETGSPMAHFDGEALLVAWNQAVDGATRPFLARFACDGAMLAGPVQLGEGIDDPFVRSLVPVETGAVALLGNESYADDTGWDGYVQHIGADLSLSASVAIAPDEVTSYPRAMVAHDGELVAAVMSPNEDVPDLDDILFIRVSAEGTPGDVIARYPTGGFAWEVALASGDELHAVWIAAVDWDYSAVGAVVGGPAETLAEPTGGYVAVAADGDRVVRSWSGPMGTIVSDEQGRSLAITESSGEISGLGLSPAGEGLFVSSYYYPGPIAAFDAEMSSYEVVKTASMVGMGDPQHLANGTWLLTGWNESTSSGRIEYLRP